METTIVGHGSLRIAILAALGAVPVFAETPLLEQGRSAIGRGDTAAAVDILEKAVAQSPDSAEAHFYLAEAHIYEGQKSGMFAAAKHLSKARAEYEKAIALDPKHVQARFGLLQIHARTPAIMGGSDKKALEQAREIKAIDPIVGHRAYASVYELQKKPDLAKQEYLAAIREQPDSPKAHSFYGQYLANVEKNAAAAFEEFETALKVDPGYMPALYHIGRTAAESNTNLPRGEEALKKYLTYTPKENEPAPARAHYFLGALYEKRGNKEDAVRNYEAALKLNPGLKEASEALKQMRRGA